MWVELEYAFERELNASIRFIARRIEMVTIKNLWLPKESRNICEKCLCFSLRSSHDVYLILDKRNLRILMTA